VLRKARPGDCQAIFSINNDADEHAAYFHLPPRHIGILDHILWFRKRVEKPCFLVLADRRDSAVAYLRLDEKPEGKRLSIAIAREYQDQGIGSTLLRIVNRRTRDIGAWVWKENKPSLKAFRRAGWDEEKRKTGSLFHSTGYGII